MYKDIVTALARTTNITKNNKRDFRLNDVYPVSQANLFQCL